MSKRWHLPASLPSLVGWVRSGFLLIWGALFIFAIIGTIVSIRPTLANRPMSATHLVGLAINADDLDVVEMPVGSQAAVAGVRPGDAIRAIDGHTPRTIEERDRLLSGPQGTKVAIDVQSAGGRVRRVSLTRSTEHEQEAAAHSYLRPNLPIATKVLLGYVAALLLLGCAAALVLRRMSDPLAPWASLGILLVMITTTPVAGWVETFPSPFLAMLQQANLSGFLLIACVLALFPAGQFDPKRLTWLTAGAIILFGELSTLLSDLAGNLVLIACFIAAIALIRVRYHRLPPGVQRQQMRWALFGFTGSIIAYGIFAALIALRPATYESEIWTDLAIQLSAVLVNVLLSLAITVSLLRYRLYNADAAISRSAVYGALTVLLLAVFAGSEKLVEIVGEHYFGQTIGTLAAVLAAAVAAATLVPLHHRVSHWAEHRFQRPLMHLRQGLPLLVGDLRETSNVERIASATLKEVNAGLRARASALTINGATVATEGVQTQEVEAWLLRNDLGHTAVAIDRSDPLFPVRMALKADGHGQIGYLLVGSRPDGTLYSRADIDVLVALSDPVTRALEIAAAREATLQEDRHEREQMRTRVAALEEMVSSLVSMRQRTA